MEIVSKYIQGKRQMKKKKKLKKYRKEYMTLYSMYLCSTRYLSSTERYKSVGEEQHQIDERLMKEFHNMYDKYTHRLEKKCMKLGKRIEFKSED